MMTNDTVKGLSKLILMHLLPGIVVAMGIWLLSEISIFDDYPRVFVMGVAVLVFLVPIELGILTWVAWREGRLGHFTSLFGLKTKLKWWSMLLYVLGLFLVTGLVFKALSPISQYLMTHVFNWLPDGFYLNQDMTSYPKEILIGTRVMQLVALTVLGPLVEELYFRGFLLDRMKSMGYWGVLLNTILFSVYHFWSPWMIVQTWMIVVRIIGLLPLYLGAYKKDSLAIAIAVHMLCNLTDVFVMLPYIFFP